MEDVSILGKLESTFDGEPYDGSIVNIKLWRILATV